MPCARHFPFAFVTWSSHVCIRMVQHRLENVSSIDHALLLVLVCICDDDFDLKANSFLHFGPLKQLEKQRVACTHKHRF